MCTEIDKQELWEILTKRTLVQQLQDSLALDEPTNQLLNSFVDIATRMMNRAQFQHYSLKEEMINEAVLLMLQNWKKAAVGIANNTVLPYFAQLALVAIYAHTQRESKQSHIKRDLKEHLEIQ